MHRESQIDVRNTLTWDPHANVCPTFRQTHALRGCLVQWLSTGWQWIATFLVVALCLVQWLAGEEDNQILGIFYQNGGWAHPTKTAGWDQPLLAGSPPNRFVVLTPSPPIGSLFSPFNLCDLAMHRAGRARRCCWDWGMNWASSLPSLGLGTPWDWEWIGWPHRCRCDWGTSYTRTEEACGQTRFLLRATRQPSAVAKLTVPSELDCVLVFSFRWSQRYITLWLPLCQCYSDFRVCLCHAQSFASLGILYNDS
jgi:hypothetical protein